MAHSICKTILSRAFMFNISNVRYITSKVENKIVQNDTTQKSVFISQSNDIYTNLALEDWIFKNMDFTNHQIMMLWRNNPCVVIGRHQNPWLEANIPYLYDNNIAVARRNSGGGAVYHDLGNINITFFTTKDKYNRKENLEILKRVLWTEYKIQADINERLDIRVEGKYKVSGTASKLAKDKAYHHCTLLVSSNKKHLSKALTKELGEVKSNATTSTVSPILNLLDLNSDITIDGLQTAIGWEYLQTGAGNFDVSGEQPIKKQNGFQMINPTDNWFPGVTDLRSNLYTWDWVYGKTPQFVVSCNFPVPRQLLSSQLQEIVQDLTINMKVENGLISDVTLMIPPNFIEGISGETTVVTHLKGKPFTAEILSFVHGRMSDELTIGDYTCTLDRRQEFVANCVLQVMKTV